MWKGEFEAAYLNKRLSSQGLDHDEGNLSHQHDGLPVPSAVAVALVQKRPLLRKVGVVQPLAVVPQEPDGDGGDADRVADDAQAGERHRGLVLGAGRGDAVVRLQDLQPVHALVVQSEGTEHHLHTANVNTGTTSRKSCGEVAFAEDRREGTLKAGELTSLVLS